MNNEFQMLLKVPLSIRGISKRNKLVINYLYFKN